MELIDRHLWVDLIRTGYGPSSPTSRHVLLALNIFMSESGDAFPSTRTIAVASGLSERSVCTHLIQMQNQGWILRRTAGKGGQGWKRYMYQVSIPDGEYTVKRKETELLVTVIGTEYSSVPLSTMALNAIQHLDHEGTEPHAEGTEPHSKKVLKDVQSKSSLKSTKKSLAANSGLKKMKEAVGSFAGEVP